LITAFLTRSDAGGSTVQVSGVRRAVSLLSDTRSAFLGGRTCDDTADRSRSTEELHETKPSGGRPRTLWSPCSGRQLHITERRTSWFSAPPYWSAALRRASSRWSGS